MRPLRPPTYRPEFLVDHQGIPVVDDTSDTHVGFPNPLGNQRLVKAIPLNESETGPVQLRPHVVVHDNDGYYLGDPDGTLVGLGGVWVHRILYARWTEDTRRLT